MSGVSEEKLKEILIDVMNDNRSINNETHSAHHAFVANEIQKCSDRTEMYKKFKLTLIGTMAIGFASGMVWIGKIVVEALSKGHHP